MIINSKKHQNFEQNKNKYTQRNIKITCGTKINKITEALTMIINSKKHRNFQQNKNKYTQRNIKITCGTKINNLRGTSKSSKDEI
jgi:hypothetical protein